MITEEMQIEHMKKVKRMEKRIKGIERGMWLIFIFTFVTMVILLFMVG